MLKPEFAVSGRGEGSVALLHRVLSLGEHPVPALVKVAAGLGEALGPVLKMTTAESGQGSPLSACECRVGKAKAGL